jgi:hypothetical protein
VDLICLEYGLVACLLAPHSRGIAGWVTDSYRLCGVCQLVLREFVNLLARNRIVSGYVQTVC